LRPNGHINAAKNQTYKQCITKFERCKFCAGVAKKKSLPRSATSLPFFSDVQKENNQRNEVTRLSTSARQRPICIACSLDG
jgi:hypothetical protein